MTTSKTFRRAWELLKCRIAVMFTNDLGGAELDKAVYWQRRLIAAKGDLHGSGRHTHRDETKLLRLLALGNDDQMAECRFLLARLQPRVDASEEPFANQARILIVRARLAERTGSLELAETFLRDADAKFDQSTYATACSDRFIALYKLAHILQRMGHAEESREAELKASTVIGRYERSLVRQTIMGQPV